MIGSRLERAGNDLDKSSERLQGPPDYSYGNAGESEAGGPASWAILKTRQFAERASLRGHILLGLACVSPEAGREFRSTVGATVLSVARQGQSSQ